MYSKRYPDRVYCGKPDPKPKGSTMTIRQATPEELAELNRKIEEKYKYSPTKQRGSGIGRMTWKKTKREEDEEEKESENAKMAGEVSLDESDGDEEDDYGDGNEEK